MVFELLVGPPRIELGLHPPQGCGLPLSDGPPEAMPRFFIEQNSQCFCAKSFAAKTKQSIPIVIKI